MGTWSDSFLSSFQFWVSCVAIGGTALGLISAIFTLLARQESSVRQSAKEEQRTGRITVAEQALELTKEDLSKAQAEAKAARELAVKLEIAARPKPFKDRLISCLNEINPKLIEGLTPGVNQLRILATPLLLGELERLAKEPEARDIVALDWDNRTSVASNMGSFVEFNIAINADLLK